ncbi:hypothetical protein DL93DRAFT_506360 [Clavulina sp. PMI_390]|nr:hypothetical protein DL93DRAFT_506360 [Clavulina sp. PMI_390]
MSHLRDFLQQAIHELKNVVESSQASEEAELASPNIDHEMPWEDNDRELIRQTIDLLQKQRSLIQKAQWRNTARQMRKRNQIQPIFRLPKEILIYIIELAIPMIGDVWSELAPNSPDQKPRWKQWTVEEYESFRHSLIFTCSTFSSLIMRSPRCWSCISLTLTRFRASAHRSPVEAKDLAALKNSLERSSPAPFDIFITNEASVVPPVWYGLRQLLSSHLHRCRGILLANAYPTDEGV